MLDTYSSTESLTLSPQAQMLKKKLLLATKQKSQLQKFINNDFEGISDEEVDEDEKQWKQIEGKQLMPHMTVDSTILKENDSP